MYTHVLLITLHTPWCMQDHYARSNDKCTYMCYWYHYLHHVVCQICISDLMMNAHTSLLITYPTPWCMCDHYGRFNDWYAQICYW